MADPYITPHPPTPHLIALPAASAETTTPATDERTRALTESEHTFVAVVVALVAALGLLGFVNSFARVNAAAAKSFGMLSFTVPLGIDLGIAVFSALDIVLARLHMRVRWVRLIPWGLTATTVYLNVAGETSTFGMVAHAVLPALWVAAVEIGGHVVRVRARLTSATRMDRVRGSRWLLDPWRTAMLRRRMVLWEIRSYPDALRRERDRVLALTDLQDTYRPLVWRWRAPRRVKALYRLGELAPARPAPPALNSGHGTGHGADNATGTVPETRPGTVPSTGRKPKPSTGRSRTRARRTAPDPDVEDLMPAGRVAAAAIGDRGDLLTRDALAAALREAGRPVGTRRAGALLTRLKTEPAADADAEGVDQ